MATSEPGMANAQCPSAKLIPRRGFAEMLLGGGFLATAAAFIYPVLRYFVPPQTADLGGDSVVAAKVGDLKPNSGKIFRFGTRPGLLILSANGEYRAMSAVCTHLGCTVQYRSDCVRSGAHVITGPTISTAATSPALRPARSTCSMYMSVATRSS